MKRILLPLTLLLCGLCTAAPADSKPNIIYFLVDDLGYADCGFNGGKDIQTPHIDKLAKAGAVLKSYYVQPVCSPTRAALMTGRLATHTGVYTVVKPGAPWGLPLKERTLPQSLRDAGYTTAICGKWHLGDFKKEYLPTRRGFDHQYGHLFGALDYFTHVRDGKPDWYRDDQPLVEEGYSTQLIAKEASRLIRAQPAGKPLFLYVPFNGIHGPHQVPESYTLPYKDLPKLRRTIAGMLAAVDEAIGSITATLEEKGMSKDTLIIFSSDNGGPGPGTATFNTPLRAGKGTLYEGGIRVSAFANWPDKIPAGTTINEPVHISDWYPTLLKLAGASTTPPNPLDGQDIWPVLTKGAKSPHTALLIPGSRPLAMALRMGDWKLLVGASDKNAGEGGGEGSDSGKVELYHLAEDLSEKNNLAAAQPDKVKEMRSILRERLKDAAAPGDPADKPAKRSRAKAAQ